LAHQTFVEYFRTAQDDPVALRILERLITVAEDLPDPRLPTYLERHLADHAAQAGGNGWQLLAHHTNVLDRLDPTSVTVATRARFTDLPAAIAGVVGAHHLLHKLPVGERTGPRQLSMARQSTTLDDNRAVHHYAQWTVRWANLTPQPVSLTLGGRDQSAGALTVFTGPGGLHRLASAGTRHAIDIWDPVTGIQVHQLTGHRESVAALAALRSPDGRTWLISGGWDDTVRIWDPVDGRPVHLLKGHTNTVTGVTGFVGAHRHMLAASVGHDGTLRVWDPMTGRQLRSVILDPDGLTAVTAFQDRQGRSYLLAGGNGGISVLDAMTSQQIVRLTGHSNFVSALVILPGPQGRPILASGSWDKSIKIWDTSTWRQIAHLTGHSDWVRDLAVLPAPDSSWILVSAGDSTVRFWEPSSGQERHRFTAHRRIAGALAPFTGPDGHPVLASSGDDALRLWDLGAILDRETEPSTGPGWVHSLTAFTAGDGQPLLATGGHDGAVHLWDPRTGELLKRHTPRHEPVSSIAAFARPDGRVLLATDTKDLTVAFWEPFTGKVFTEIKVGGNNTIVAFAPTPGYSGVVTAGSHVDIWNLTEDRKIHLSQRMTIHVAAAFALANGKRMVATVNDRTIRLWDADSGLKLGKLAGHRERITAMQHLDTPNGTTLLASGGADHQVRIWDPLVKQLIHQITDHTATVTAMTALSGAYGDTLLATADHSGIVLITDPVSNVVLARLTLGMEITALAALPDRALAISGPEGVIAVDIHHTRWNGPALTTELRAPSL
jgi:WD40 repeat protein